MRAGAIPMGKTVTTEFAYFSPGATRNPHNLNHTPGGSSSGSAAAVADGMAALGLGSQTAASLTRPAARIVLFGYKASQGSIDLQGVMGLASSLDSLGLLARGIDDLILARAALCETVLPGDRQGALITTEGRVFQRPIGMRPANPCKMPVFLALRLCDLRALV